MIRSFASAAAAAAFLGVAFYLVLTPSAPSFDGALGVTKLATPTPSVLSLEPLESSSREHSNRATALADAQPNGSAWRARFHWDQNVSIGDHMGAGTKLTLRIDGVMHCTPLAQHAGEQAIELAFEEIKANANAGSDGEVALSDLEHELSVAAILYADARSWPLAYHFPAGYSARTRNFVRSIATALAFPLPEEGKVLQLKGADAGGTFTAELELLTDSSGEHRTLKRKFAPPKRDEVSSEGDAEPSGRGSARFSDSQGPWVSAEYVEDSFAQVELPGARMEGRLAIQAELLDQRRVWLAGGEHAVWNCERHPLAGDAERDDDAETAIARRERERVRDLHALPLAFELAGLVQSGARRTDRFAEAWRDLRLLLEHDEAQLAEICHLIEAGTFSPEVVDALLAAVGAAGPIGARRWLVDLARREAVLESTRASALRSLFQGEAIPIEIRSAVRELTSTIADPRSEAGRTALLLLGRYASVADEEGEQAWSALVTSAGRCAEQGLIETWIHALANSRRPEARELIEAQLASPHAGVRSAAELALQDFGGR